MIFKLAIKDITRNPRLIFFFILNLSLGLGAFVSLQSFNKAINAELSANQKNILSADLAISARRKITDNELSQIKELLPKDSKISHGYDFFAMMSLNGQSRLVSVKAIDSNFPLYGELEMSQGKTSKHLNLGEIWLYQEFQSQMQAQSNQRAQLGNKTFIIRDFIYRDQTQTFRAGNLAPRVFILNSDLESTGLLKFGSTFSENYFFSWEQNTDSELIYKNVLNIIKDPQLSVTTAKMAGEGAGKQVAYLADYLGLVSIVAVLLSLLGAAYIFRLYLSNHIKEIAILRALGMQSQNATIIYLLVILLICLMAVPAVFIVQSTLSPFLADIIQQVSSVKVSIQADFDSLILITIISVVGGLLVNIPLLQQLGQIQASALLGEETHFTEINVRQWWLYLPLIILVYSVCIAVSHSIKNASYFMASIAVIITIFFILVTGLRKMMLKFESKNWSLRYVFRSLSRRPGQMMALYIAIGIGSLLINLMPQLKSSLQDEFDIGEKSKLPSLFMFDIQDEQIEPLKIFLADKKLPTPVISAMIRARILKINDQTYERAVENSNFQTREEEQEARFRNRGVNLSYRPKLSASEEIITGHFWSQPMTSTDASSQPELSIEKSYAERMKIKLNDLIQFDIQGVEITGKVTSIRKIKWTSFEPNFFILLQPGSIDDAPKTHILSLPHISNENKALLQNELAHKFSNISIIDVARTVESVLAQAKKMSWSLELMAWLALLTGYIVIFTIVRTNMQSRFWEWNMLKILGASGKQIYQLALGELATTTVIASITGIVLSHLLAFILSQFIFSGSFKVNLFSSISSFAIINSIAMLVGWISARSIIKKEALGVLTNK